MKNYDKTLIFYVNTLQKQGIITWCVAVKLYEEISGQNIVKSTLINRAKKIKLEEVDLQLFFKYCENTERLIKKQDSDLEDDSKVNLPEINIYDNSMTRTLSITKDDYVNVFGVDFDKDSIEEIRKKVLVKISNEVFLLSYMGFNPGVYEVKKIISGGWTTPVKIKSNQNEKLHIVQNDKFTIIIEKRKKEMLFYTKEECEKFLDDYLSKRLITPFDLFESDQEIKELVELDNDIIMVCPGLELHLGKLASVVDYEDFSTKQAMWRIKKVAKEIVDYQRKFQAGNLVLGVGNDYFNSDTVDDKTTAGTPQNNDTRFKEVYLWGKLGYLQLIETLKREFNKIIIKGNPGNHDEKTSFSLFTNIYDLYNLTEDKKVEVEFSYKDMRYTTCYEFGDSLIIFSHGKNPEGKPLNDKELAASAFNQFPEEVSRVKNVYLFAGHIHQDSRCKIDHTKVTVIRTASLSGIDSWHSNNNYLGQRQGHSVYLIHRIKGLIGQCEITLTDDDKKRKISSVSRKESIDVYKEMRKKFDLNPNSVDNELVNDKLSCLDDKVRKLEHDYDEIIERMASLLGGSVTRDNLVDLRKTLDYNGSYQMLLNKVNGLKKVLKKE